MTVATTNVRDDLLTDHGPQRHGDTEVGHSESI
jgi:hypothetical protein